MFVPEKLCRNISRSLGAEGIHIDLRTDAAKILENNRFIHRCWYQLYLDSIYQLLIRPCKWEKSGQLLQIDDILLFTFTDSGYPEKAIYCM